MNVFFMLNLPVAMMKEFVLFFVSLFWLSPLAAPAPAVEIVSPQKGQVLQGSVEIIGTIPPDGFVSGEVSYAYSQSDTETWFSIGSISQPVTNGILAVWDTSTISDGDYKIKVTVNDAGSEPQEVVVNQVLVRNYTPVQSTATPVPQATVNSETVTPTFLATQLAVATPYPPNPGALTALQVRSGMRFGIILGVLAMAALGIYALLHYLRFHR
jgi:hypothetical protein